MADMKTIKVCLSKDLPSLQDRDSNTIYFLRDKLIIYLGRAFVNKIIKFAHPLCDFSQNGRKMFAIALYNREKIV